jgi:hypothetical protein
VGMFRDSLFTGTFPLLHFTNISPINMISSFTSGSIESLDSSMVPHLEEVEFYGVHMLLTLVFISYQVIQSTCASLDLYL